MLRIDLFIIHSNAERKTGGSYLMQNALLHLEITRKLPASLTHQLKLLLNYFKK